MKDEEYHATQVRAITERIPLAIQELCNAHEIVDWTSGGLDGAVHNAFAATFASNARLLIEVFEKEEAKHTTSKNKAQALRRAFTTGFAVRDKYEAERISINIQISHSGVNFASPKEQVIGRRFRVDLFRKLASDFTLFKQSLKPEWRAYPLPDIIRPDPPADGQLPRVVVGQGVNEQGEFIGPVGWRPDHGGPWLGTNCSSYPSIDPSPRPQGTARPYNNPNLKLFRFK